MRQTSPQPDTLSWPGPRCVQAHGTDRSLGLTASTALARLAAQHKGSSERESPQVEEKEVRKGSWVRTGESGVGLSEGRKGGLLHGQLVELGQLLGQEGHES